MNWKTPSHRCHSLGVCLPIWHAASLWGHRVSSTVHLLCWGLIVVSLVLGWWNSTSDVLCQLARVGLLISKLIGSLWQPFYKQSQGKAGKALWEMWGPRDITGQEVCPHVVHSLLGEGHWQDRVFEIETSRYTTHAFGFLFHKLHIWKNNLFAIVAGLVNEPLTLCMLSSLPISYTYSPRRNPDEKCSSYLGAMHT